MTKSDEYTRHEKICFEFSEVVFEFSKKNELSKHEVLKQLMTMIVAYARVFNLSNEDFHANMLNLSQIYKNEPALKNQKNEKK